MKEMKECKEMVRTARTDENKCQQINVFFLFEKTFCTSFHLRECTEICDFLLLMAKQMAGL